MRNLWRDEKVLDVGMMQEQGWMLGEPYDELNVEAEGDEVTLVFVE